ncbi:MAG TPA: HDOD domain-containing protein [Phycisphaerales bacterium]|nr:HDOD domain-containing protein [Phycisphaerales bacterium]
MAVQTPAPRDQVVAAAVRELSHIATLPEITLRIIALVEDPRSTAQDLHKVIANDPALCSRILKVVNSAFYGLPGQIGSINRAIVLLGLNAVKNIAIAASLAKLFRGGALTPSFSAKDLWAHSMAVAAASKLLADSMKMGLTDEAFLAGLIHDIGMVVEIQYDRNKMIEVVERSAPSGTGPGADMLAAEESVFGATHQDFGRGLCEKWKFPRSFAHVTGHHHDPMRLPTDSRTMACLVCLADRMAGTLSVDSGGFRLDLPSLAYPADVLDELKLTQARVDELAGRLPEMLEAVRQILA